MAISQKVWATIFSVFLNVFNIVCVCVFKNLFNTTNMTTIHNNDAKNKKSAQHPIVLALSKNSNFIVDRFK
jgi:hypothetical protein